MGNKKNFSLSEPILGDIEIETLKDVIESGWITMGNRVQQFESAFADIHQIPYALAVNSCTAGLHLALSAFGVKAGDEVLVPSLSFVATANTVIYTGATPKFVDIISIEQPHICIEHAKSQLSSKTKAVIVMHYAGYVIDMSAWQEFAKTYDLCLIEDAAHAPGAKDVGLYSDASIFSFFANKNMTTAEGGMVITRHQWLADSMRNMRSHGMTTGTLERHRGHAYSYDVTALGYNYRFDELRAAIGLVQLKRLNEWNIQRNHLNLHYRKLLLEHCPKITIPFSSWEKTVAHLMPIVLPDHLNRQDVMSILRQDGVQTSIHYPPIHQFTWYRENYSQQIGDSDLSITEQFCATELSLPLHPKMTEQDVEYIVECLARIVALS